MILAVLIAIVTPSGPVAPARPAATPTDYRFPRLPPMGGASRRPDPDINAVPNARHRSQLERCGRKKHARDVQDSRCAPGGNGY